MKIGNTPLIRLGKVEKAYGLTCPLYAKDESQNAGGSIKDRVALAILNQAEKEEK